MTPNPRSGQSTSQTIYSSNPRPRAGHDANRNHHQIFQVKRSGIGSGPDSAVGEGCQKLKNRLTSRGVPESIVEELLEQPTIVNYRRGSFIFLQGAPTDLVFWVSRGLVDILCPGPDGKETRASVLGPGDLFGFVENTDHKGRPVQALQARARTDVQIGLLIRERMLRALGRQNPALLLHITEQIIAAWSEFTLCYMHFLGKSYDGRLKMVLADLAMKFGVKESRGTLLIPEFGHGDFAEMIGCSRPMVSRLIAEMISEGSLARNGKHYIIMEERLAVDPRCSQGGAAGAKTDSKRR